MISIAWNNNWLRADLIMVCDIMVTESKQIMIDIFLSYNIINYKINTVGESFIISYSPITEMVT